MRNLVTGATGFLGSYIAKKLKNNGEEVVCLARKSSNTNFLETLDTKIIYGDITNNNSVRKAMEGIDRVYHAAAITGEWIGKKQAYESNINGTKNLLTVALENKIDRFLFISSLAVMGLKDQHHTGIETNYKKVNDNYIDTKIESEKLVKMFHDCNIDIKARAETLTKEDFMCFVRKL